jgi:UDPglucose 6-dehydrogenase
MKIGIIGVGKLGLCFALNLSRFGFDVIGYDIRENYIDSLLRKDFISIEPMVNDMLQSSSVCFTTNINKACQSDILFIFVNTPSNLDGSFNHSQINSVFDKIQSYSNTIVICSTVMPGYCNSLHDSRIVYSPQFVAQGSIIQNQISPDLVLIGATDNSRAEIVKNIYFDICNNYPNCRILDCLSAEIAKVALNCYVTMKISFANNLGDICKFAGANCDGVLSAISSDSRIGEKCFKYGYGYGGPCFPRDNKAFIHFANNYVQPYLSEAVDKINEDHLIRQLKLIEKGILPSNLNIAGEYATITGICFKSDSNILDESQQLRLAMALKKKYNVKIRDSKIVIDELNKNYGNIFMYEEI